uniref:Uncharacterized protein n=1 Tax=Pipistrellus kuhlii TaxID=59472 RepID=A0A7J7T2C2_PIPKU|nr:hypothetical protein mPipKuh1_009716 [Pipistrellus kuhlii]
MKNKLLHGPVCVPSHPQRTPVPTRARAARLSLKHPCIWMWRGKCQFSGLCLKASTSFHCARRQPTRGGSRPVTVASGNHSYLRSTSAATAFSPDCSHSAQNGLGVIRAAAEAAVECIPKEAETALWHEVGFQYLDNCVSRELVSSVILL